MSLTRWNDVHVLTGPTASGKTAVGLELAERLGAEIISMDSMAVYRDMDIGTAKPTLQECARVRHHLVDVRRPSEQATVAWWLTAAHQAVADIRARGQRILFVGGTPLYLKALLRGLFPGPAADVAVRQQLATLSNAEIRAELQRVDPTSAERLHANDRKRLLRALEVWKQTGKPMSTWQTQFDKPLQLGRPGLWLDWPRAELHRRINTRVEVMLAGGLLEECKALSTLEQPLCLEAQGAAGYAEAFATLDGELTMEEARVAIQARTRQLAKRQVTWFRHLEELRPLAVTVDDTPATLAEKALTIWR